MATLTDHDVFWLARYAHNTLAPLFAEAKAIEPSYCYRIEMDFADENSPFHKYTHVAVAVYADHGGCRIIESSLTSKADIATLALKIRADIEKLKSEALQPA